MLSGTATFQTIKKLGILQLEDNPPDIHRALETIIKDIRTTKRLVTCLDPFKLHFGRKPKS